MNNLDAFTYRKQPTILAFHADKPVLTDYAYSFYKSRQSALLSLATFYAAEAGSGPIWLFRRRRVIPPNNARADNASGLQVFNSQTENSACREHRFQQAGL